MNNKKVLFCASTASHIMNFHMPYIEYFKSLGYTVNVAAMGNICSEFIDNFYDFDFDKHFLSLKNIKAIYKLSELIRREKYSLISSHATLAGAIARVALMLAGKNNTLLFHTVHGYLIQNNSSLKAKMYLFIEKILADKTDLLITMNKADYQIASRYKLCKRIEFVHGCGIVRTKFPIMNAEEIQRKKREYGIKRQDKVLFYAAEFSKRKNHKMLINALAKALQNIPQMKLLLAGEGMLKAECICLVNSLGIEKNVIFCGQVSDINSLYRISDVAVSSAISEGLPFNIMEALHCGLPVIATKIKGHSDLLNNGVNGYLVKLDDIEKFSGCIVKLMTDTDLYLNIKAAAFLPEEYYIESVFLEWKAFTYPLC